MTRTTSVAVCAVWLCLSGPAIAHHSVGINFDASKAFTLTGVLKELDIRNPHSQITLSVKGADGIVKDWFIEWSDKNALIRRKVRYEQMKIGDTVVIRVSPSRRLENVAYFQSATLADGSILRDCGAGALADAVEKGADLDCPQVAR
jgi:uncharacterized protein DUF6152